MSRTQTSSLSFSSVKLFKGSYNPNAKAANAMTILYVNSVNCLPVISVLVILSGELTLMQGYAHWHEPGFIVALVFTTAFACVFR